MPIVLRIDTSVSHVDIDDEFLVQSTEALAKTFQKPKSVSIYLHYYYHFFHKTN